MKLKNIVPEYYSKLYLVRKLFWDRIKYAVKFADIKDNYKILGIGCGAGQLLHHINKKYKKCICYGIDINPNIKKLNFENQRFSKPSSRGITNLKIADARNLPFKDNFFDVVFALDTFEHIEDAEKAILETKRVLKHNGYLIVSGPTENFFHKFARFILKGTFSLKSKPEMSPHYHNIYKLRNLIVSNKFKIIKQKRLPIYCPPIVLIIALKNIKTN